MLIFAHSFEGILGSILNEAFELEMMRHVLLNANISESVIGLAAWQP